MRVVLLRDMAIRSVEHTFQDSEVGDNTAGIEVLGMAEHDLISIYCDFQIIVCSWHARLFGRADQIGGGGLEKVIAEKNSFETTPC
ncbi:hypothetical protein EYZ11_001271 [Aspergillus tanneri]|uniref:Uncharacterized protein n=1 Tax=Aspergillus tanneri TaxID=1220188 RepID=A0A4S3JV23_9EURO|nr:hypothetical protein EYZ11_001271 [Aspergillus tanneri]